LTDRSRQAIEDRRMRQNIGKLEKTKKSMIH